MLGCGMPMREAMPLCSIAVRRGAGGRHDYELHVTQVSADCALVSGKEKFVSCVSLRMSYS